MHKPSPRPRSTPSPGRPTPAPAAPTSTPRPRPRPAPLTFAPRTEHDTPARLTFGPEWRTTFIAIPGAGFAALIAFFADEPVQRVFAGVVVVALLLIAAADVCFSPRLTVTGEEVRVHGPFDRARLPWNEIDTIQATSSTRFGLHTALLEINAGERLIVLDKKDLAADPWAVAGKIAEFRAATR